MFYKTLLTALLLTTFSTAHSVEASDFSIGLNVGSAKYSTQTNNTAKDDTDLVYGIYGQYAFTPHFAFQLQSSNLGTYSFDTHTTEFKAFSFAAIGQLKNYNGFTPYGKLGYSLLNMNQKVDVLSIALNNETNGDAFLGAIGVQYALPSMPEISFKLEIENYVFFTQSLSGVGEDETNNLSGVNLGATNRF